MKQAARLFALLICGALVGGGAALGVSQAVALGEPNAARPAAHDEPPVFVDPGTLLVPIVAPDRKLSGYARISVQLDVEAENADGVTAQVPLLLHAINLRAWQTPLASGPDHMLPDLRAFSMLVEKAAQDAVGKGAVRRAVITSVRPA